jgi:hypothetical protein
MALNVNIYNSLLLLMTCGRSVTGFVDDPNTLVKEEINFVFKYQTQH